MVSGQPPLYSLAKGLQRLAILPTRHGKRDSRMAAGQEAGSKGQEHLQEVGASLQVTRPHRGARGEASAGPWVQERRAIRGKGPEGQGCDGKPPQAGTMGTTCVPGTSQQTIQPGTSHCPALEVSGISDSVDTCVCRGARVHHMYILNVNGFPRIRSNFS